MQSVPPALVVSIHDVSPLTFGRVGDMLADLDSAGVNRTSLLVIPNHHHRAPVADFPKFAAWLRGVEADGHECVLHGYYHKRPASGRGLAQRLITETYTAGEGEFHDLDATEAGDRVRRGRSELHALGVREPRGFIAPAWLLGAEAERAVGDAGFSYTTRLGTVVDLRDGAEWRSQSLVWSVRAGWRRVMSLAWNARLAHSLRADPLLRIGLHPPDWDFPSIRSQALRLIGDALAGRDVLTYEAWLDLSRK